MSFNLLKLVPEGLAEVPTLKTVFFVQNKISKINNLDPLVNLTSLELGGNRLRVMPCNSFVLYPSH